MLLLAASLLWALWDEAYGQRPWKSYQHEWTQRYSAFLNTAKSGSADAQKAVEGDPEYQHLQQQYQSASDAAKPKRDAIQTQLNDLNANLLAVQSVFTDRRAYVNALTYEIETGNKGVQSKLDKFKAEKATVKFPDGHKEQYNYEELEA